MGPATWPTWAEIAGEAFVHFSDAELVDLYLFLHERAGLSRQDAAIR
jgi:hypothetical protein